jgi:hypothetical protein
MTPILKRWVTFVVAIGCCAFSFPAMFWNKQDRVDEHFGLFEEGRVAAAWAQITQPGRLFHDLKNFLVEWTRSNPQRAAKFFSACVVVGIIGWLI